MFFHRRKFLRANVVAAMKRHLDKQQVDAMLGEMGFRTETHTEQLDVPTLIALAEKIHSLVPDRKLLKSLISHREATTILHDYTPKMHYNRTNRAEQHCLRNNTTGSNYFPLR